MTWCRMTHWLMSLVAERPPKAAVGFRPSMLATDTIMSWRQTYL